MVRDMHVFLYGQLGQHVSAGFTLVQPQSKRRFCLCCAQILAQRTFKHIIAFLLSQPKSSLIFQRKFEDSLATCCDAHYTSWRPASKASDYCSQFYMMMILYRRFLGSLCTASGGSVKMVLRRSLRIRILWCSFSTCETRKKDA